jgi:hypothetical protein
MKFFQKYSAALLGLWLTFRNRKVFDLEILKGKRIVIVGAASSALNTGKGGYIDDFDLVVRINKATALVDSGKFKADIGTRTDILFHSFFENDFSGGGPLDFTLFHRLGIKYVINPIPTYFGWRQTYNFYKKYQTNHVTYTLPSSLYEKVESKFKKFRPTTGFCALLTLLNSNCSELYITGFTFFKTPYAEGYRDALKDVEVNKKYILDSKQHDPEIEFKEFKNFLRLPRNGKVILDPALQSIIENN